MVLIIGNQNYNEGYQSLGTPINDANAVYKVFTDLLKIEESHIFLMIDKTAEEINDLFKKLLKFAKNDPQ